MGVEIPVEVGKHSNNKQLIEKSLNHPYSEGIREALAQLRYNFVLTDPCLCDHPIVYASEGFLKMTGYSSEEVVGRNARFLQGPGTDRRTVLEIREAIRQEKSCQVCILNYRKDGASYWSLFHMAPVFSKNDGRVIHFVGVQIPLSKFREDSSSSSVLIGNKTIDLSTSSDDKLSRFYSPNGVTNGVIYSGSCRKELLANFSIDLGRSGLYNPVTANKSDIEHETCEAKDSDKQRAIDAWTSVFFELAQFSKLTGSVVSDSRCCTTTKVVAICSSLSSSLSRIQQSFVLADPHAQDMPIVYASNMFLQLTGYSKEEVIGRNCRFLQGSLTDRLAIVQIRKSIQTNQSCTVQILNYRKDGSSFWNLLQIAPIRNASGKIAFYAGIQIELPDNKEEENDTHNSMSPRMNQLSALGAIRIAVRSLLGMHFSN
uniref:Putative LOV domain-containing protein n=1 Tax=Welwitschia mirabilis TaxID=3377 RepID=A0A126X213_WELMI|nr:putative LOV domain-containing protein [Welwitschia mirabilis]|eukprot:TRINITY_DN1143_c0_g1_i1.p1 TRINITY_DN1143_c0_g1~~TRINITY_DN1143_c0_g1_i1.p1  ORF type:complete len:429 (+),score=66.41 TRINITY_DN1143_c0_g1_i1:728-2014(+)